MEDAQVTDLICIGFGASALSLAVALKERHALENTVFLEKESESAWKPSKHQASSRMETSFLKDLITSENPRSEFTFVNYLHATNQLVTFTNSGRIEPSRPAFIDYLQWVANHFKRSVSFRKQAFAVMPLETAKGSVEGWNVLYHDLSTGQKGSIIAKQVICSVGRQPKIAESLSSSSTGDLVVHSSIAPEAIASLRKAKQEGLKFAIVGDGNSAAEIFSYLQGIYGDHVVHWFTQNHYLKAAEGTPSVLEQTNNLQRIPSEFRTKLRSLAVRRQQEGLISKKLMGHIHEFLYGQSVQRAAPASRRFQIKYGAKILKSEIIAEKSVQLSLEYLNEGSSLLDNEIFDMVISATGYENGQCQTILSSLLNRIDGRKVTVATDYQVNFRSEAKNKDVGLWLVDPHIGDQESEDLTFEFAAERSALIAQSLVAQRNLKQDGDVPEEKLARL